MPVMNISAVNGLSPYGHLNLQLINQHMHNNNLPGNGHDLGPNTTNLNHSGHDYSGSAHSGSASSDTGSSSTASAFLDTSPLGAMMVNNNGALKAPSAQLQAAWTNAAMQLCGKSTLNGDADQQLSSPGSDTTSAMTGMDMPSDLDNRALIGGAMAGQSSTSPKESANDQDMSEAASTSSNHAMDGMGNDAEGVWSSDIEQAFLEALALYPPCGRRKIILSEEGKMYGRNELIARYIKLRTGKTRTRKQVSSHIQVLARKKHREVSTRPFKSEDPMVTKKEPIDNSPSDLLPSAQIRSMDDAQQKSFNAISASVQAGIYQAQAPQFWTPSTTLAHRNNHSLLGISDLKYMTPYSRPVNMTNRTQIGTGLHGLSFSPSSQVSSRQLNTSSGSLPDVPQSSTMSANELITMEAKPSLRLPLASKHAIETSRIRLNEFSAYVDDENDKRHAMVRIDDDDQHELEPIQLSPFIEKFPPLLKTIFDEGPSDSFFLVKFWADVNFNVADINKAFYGVDSSYQSQEDMTIVVSTKVCSFGKQVVEKVETEHATYDANSGQYVYKINRSPMCEYMVKFIVELRKLQNAELMNSVLENFTVLQLVQRKDTQEMLLSMALVFEVSTDAQGPECRIYRLTEDS